MDDFDWDALATRMDSATTPLGKHLRGSPVVLGVPGGEGPLAQADSKPSGISTVLSSDETVPVILVTKGPGLDICGGKIGSKGTRFCSLSCGKGLNACGRFATHEKNKAAVIVPAYYISAAKLGTSFINPYLKVPEEGFSPAILDQLSGSRTESEWNTMFTVIEKVGAYPVDDQTEVLARAARKVFMGPTPMKLRHRLLSDELDEMVDEMLDEESWDVKSPISMTSLVMEAKLDLNAAGSHVKKHWNTLVTSAIQTKRDIRDIESNTRDHLEDLDDKMLVVWASLGSKDHATNAPALTVWESVSSNSNLIRDNYNSWKEHTRVMGQRLDGVVDQVSSLRNTLTAKISPMIVKAVNFMEGRKVQVGSTSQVTSDDGNVRLFMEKTDREISSLNTRLQTITLTNREDDTGSSLREDIRRVMGEVQLLRTDVRDVEGKLSDIQAPSTEMVVQQLATLRFDMGLLRDEVALVRRENQKLRDAANTESVSFGGYYFQSVESYETFILKYHAEGNYGLCFDFVSALEAAVNNSRTGEKSLKNLTLIQKALYETTNAAWIDQSFSVLIPECFGSERDPKNATKKMGSMDSIGTWDHPSSQSGMMHDIHTLLNSHKGDIDMELNLLAQVSTTGIHQFYQTMIQEVVSFWEDLKAWIFKFERETQVHDSGDDAKVQKASVWSLLCFLIHAMFVEMQKRRAAGRTTVSVSRPTTKYALILKGTLEAHKFMAELRDAKFIRHAIFASTMSTYLLTTKATVTFTDALNKRLTIAEGTLKFLKSSADKVAARAQK